MSMVIGNGGERGEELANTVTHGAGILGAFAAAATLITLSAVHGTVWHIVGASVFSAALLLLYGASTAYHAVREPRWKTRLKVLDHAAIYVLIAGTYTPFTLAAMRGGWGWSLFGVIWGLAVVGVVFKVFTTGRFRRVSTLIYIGMGWLVLVAAGPLVRALTPVTLAWLVAGGVAYTAGTAFYLQRRIRFGHAVWHGFVLLGSVCHAVAVATLVL
jgi:hemolysin III